MIRQIPVQVRGEERGMPSRGEGVPPLLFCVEGVSPSNRGQDARDRKGKMPSPRATVRSSILFDLRPAGPQPPNGLPPRAKPRSSRDAIGGFGPQSLPHQRQRGLPGVVPTPMWEQIDRDRARFMAQDPQTPRTSPEARPTGRGHASFHRQGPAPRAGTPGRGRGGVAFLCSSDADYITGQALNVDGGFEMD